MIIGYPPFYADTPGETCKKILNWRKYLAFPTNTKISKEAIDLIKRLITDVDKRLGYNGASEIKSHPFFKDIDWNNVKRLIPPFIPKLESSSDSKYFDKFDEEDAFYPDQKEVKSYKKDVCFVDFTYKKDQEDNPIMLNAIEVMNEVKRNISECKDKEADKTQSKSHMKIFTPKNIMNNTNNGFFNSKIIISKPQITNYDCSDKENKPLNINIARTPNNLNTKINLLSTLNVKSLSSSKNNSGFSNQKSETIQNIQLKMKAPTCLKIVTPKTNILSKISLPKHTSSQKNIINVMANNSLKQKTNINFVMLKSNPGSNSGTPSKYSPYVIMNSKKQQDTNGSQVK